MSPLERLESVIAGAAPLLDPIEVTYFPEDVTWAIQFDEQTRVFLDFDDKAMALVISASVGTPPHEDRLRMYELMLQFNNQWHLTGGLRLALEGPAGSGSMIFSVPVEGLENSQLATILANFREIVLGWREIIAAPPPESGKPDEAADMAALFNMVRA
jgi:hypothetical protein